MLLSKLIIWNLPFTITRKKMLKIFWLHWSRFMPGMILVVSGKKRHIQVKSFFKATWWKDLAVDTYCCLEWNHYQWNVNEEKTGLNTIEMGYQYLWKENVSMRETIIYRNVSISFFLEGGALHLWGKVYSSRLPQRVTDLKLKVPAFISTSRFLADLRIGVMNWTIRMSKYQFFKFNVSFFAIFFVV